MNRHVWPGLASYRVNDGTASAFSMDEIPAQIKATRTRATVDGNFLYNTTWTLKRSNGALAASLAQDVYRTAALVPAMPWLDASPPAQPAISVAAGTLQITPGAGEAARWWAVRAKTGSGWTTRILFGAERSATFDSSVERVLVQSVDKAGNVSAAAEWRR